MNPLEVSPGVFLVDVGSCLGGEFRAQFEGFARAIVAAGLVPPEWAERGKNRRRHSCGYALDWEGRRLSIRYDWRPSLTHAATAERWLKVTYYSSAEELEREVEYPRPVLAAFAHEPICCLRAQLRSGPPTDLLQLAPWADCPWQSGAPMRKGTP